jgi:uncharacterized protein (DUF1800 family)
MSGATTAESQPSRWAPYALTPHAHWSLKRVVHLHRRAGFAATWRELQRDLADGPRAAITRLLEGRSRTDGLAPDFASAGNILAHAAADSQNPDRLKAWWLYRMLGTPDPLQERLVLMWHNHFATSNAKVQDLRVMLGQNQTLRELCRATFGELLASMLHDPALLVWLDAPSNQKGRPNENLARELMELFTLGVGHFSESDVKEAARALTGLSVVEGSFRFRSEFHDAETKTILGQSGKWNADDLMRILLEQPATARRLAWRLCQTFLAENIANDAILDELAAGLRAHDLSIAWGVETILRSRLFFSERNIRQRVIGPIEWMVGAVHALECFDPPPSTLLTAEWLPRLGQDLFYPPNVGGWAGGRAWLTTRTAIARANFADALVKGELRAGATPVDIEALVRRAGVNADARATAGFLNDLLLGGAMAPRDLDELADRATQAHLAQADTLRRVATLMLASPEAQLG